MPKVSESGVSAQAGVSKPKRRRTYTEKFKKDAVLAALNHPPGNRIKPTCNEYVDESGTRRFDPPQLRKWMSKYGTEVGKAAGLSDTWIGVVGASAEAPDPAEQVLDATASAVGELPPKRLTTQPYPVKKNSPSNQKEVESARRPVRSESLFLSPKPYIP